MCTANSLAGRRPASAEQTACLPAPSRAVRLRLRLHAPALNPYPSPTLTSLQDVDTIPLEKGNIQYSFPQGQPGLLRSALGGASVHFAHLALLRPGQRGRARSTQPAGCVRRPCACR